jgi:PAS domain S-box-containing protein
MEKAEAIHVQPNSGTTMGPAACSFSGCIMPAMASSGPGSERLNAQLLVDSIPALIHTARPDGYLDYFNKPWLEYLGVTLDKVAGWNWTAYVHPEDVEGIVAKWRACLATGEIFEYETRVRSANGEYRWMFHRKVPLRDANGNIVKWYGSSLDIDERKTAEEQLRRNSQDLQRSEFYLAEGQRLAHMGSWAFDPDGFYYWSPELFRMHGLDPASKPPSVQEYLDCVHPQDRESMADLIKGILAKASTFDATKRIVRPNGEVRYIRCVGAPVVENQSLKKYIGSAIDVTEHELLTQELRRREAYLAEAQWLSHTGSFGWKPDSGEIVWSDETYRIFEYDRALKLTIDSIVQRVDPENRADFLKVIDGASAGATHFEHTYRLLLPDGRVKHVHALAHVVKGASGNREFAGAVTDITEQRQAEAVIREQEAELREVVDTIPAIVWSTLPDGSNTYVNKRFVEYSGSSAEQMAGSGWQALIHPDDLERHAGNWMEAVAAGKPLENEVRSRRSDGQYRWQLDRGVPLRDEDGNIVKWYGVTTDIEDRKRAEEALGVLSRDLQENQAKLEEAQRVAHVGYWEWNLRTDHVTWSDETYRIYGLDPQEPPMDLATIRESVHPEDREFVFRKAAEAIQGEVRADVEHRIIRPSGEVRVVHSQADLKRDAAGRPWQMFGTVQDITDRKRAEESLRSSEAYLADAQRLSHTGSWAWSPDQDIRYWSEECYRVLSFDPQDGLPRFEDFFQRIHPDDQPGFRELIQTAIREKAEWQADYRIVHPDGPVRDIHVVAHPVLSTSGHLLEFVGTVIDITEHKRAEEELRRSEMELRQMLDLAPQQVAVFGSDGERLYANRVALDYIGLSLEEWRQASGNFFRPGCFFHPDDQERAARTFSEANRSCGSGYELELRVRGADGNYRWFLVRYSPLHDDKGQVKRWYLASTDIDERKRAEERLQHENVVLREELDTASMFEEIVGTSPALKSVLSRISKVAPSDSTVLITGETGTGKELVARAIHRRSDRASRAFVGVNCAAIPRDLIASELFGHEKGAFTGATQQRLGRFELANGGTIFLDEVGELPAETQIALLRVLQEHEFERVGGTRRIRADVRVIAATNRDLQAAISAGSFRSDLFYRLHVFPIEIPPLRERGEDIRLLVEYFIDRYARKAGKNIKRVSKKTLELLQSYPWPGNIRELQNVIERSVILCETEIFSIDENWLPQPPPLTPESKQQVELPRRLLVQEKDMIEAALKDTRGRISGPTGAAVKLGIPRSTLESKIRSLKIDKNRFKA